MRKEDNKLKLKELKYLIMELNIRTFLTIDKQYQCGTCLNIFNKQDKCPHCGAVKNRGISKRNHSYDKTNWIQVYRRQDNNIISLLFMIYDSKHYDKITRNIYLVRKTTYTDDMKVYVNEGLYYNNMSNQMLYYGQYENNFYECNKGVLRYKIPPYANVYNKKLLKELSSFKYCDIPYMTKDVENTIKFPNIVEMLQKYSKRNDLYSGIRTISKHQQAYKKYHNYFEMYGEFKANVLIQLAKYKQMVIYKDFERLMRISPLPKTTSYQDLIACSKLLKNDKWFDGQIYKDYLRLSKNNGLDITLSKVRFNPNWKKEHNRLSKLIKLEEAKKQNNKFIKAYLGLHNYVDKGVHVIVPKDVESLFNEGIELDHCVADYTNQIANGSSLIFFIRTKPDIPFITVEVKNKRIVQMRGNHNHQDMITQLHKTIMRKYIKKELIL